MAAIALRDLGHPDAIPALLKALDDDREPVRQWTCEALGSIAPTEELRSQIIEGLVRRLNDTSETVRTSAIRALGFIGAREATHAARHGLIRAGGSRIMARRGSG
jgi:HEAT repeat protein